MNGVASRDLLDVVGVAAGAFLVLAGLGSLAGSPWQYAGSAAVTVSIVVGSVAAIAIGAGLAWFLYTTG